MNKKSFIFILALLSSVRLVSAQSVFTGSVRNMAGKPLVGSVTTQAKGASIISGFGSTDSEGQYSVTYKGDADSITLTVSGMLIGKHFKTVKNRSQRVDFIVDEQPVELKEVNVKAFKITQSKDTLNYLVGAFTNQNDRVIGDVLRKMPGIEVADNGKLSFNGKEIKRFYVENMDLLGGKYGLATNNIPANAVSVVQVLENHQPVKALQGKFDTGDVAVNLKLKEEAKGTLALTGLLGGGYQPILWKAELTAMYFSKKKQNMTIYKGNNSGEDVASEFRTHYDYERVYMPPTSMLYTQMPSTPPVPRKRYLYNRSHAVTTNHLIKPNEDSELTTSILYYDDRIERDGYSLYEQYMPGKDRISIEERINTVSHIHNAEIASRLNVNANSYYINNALNIKANWNDDIGKGTTHSNVIPTDEVISQRLDQPFFSVDNTLNLLKTIKEHTYKLYFSTGYGRRPHTLTVSPATYLGDSVTKSLTQNCLSQDLAAVLRLSYSINLKPFIADYHLWGRTDIKNIDTELHKIESNDIPQTIPDSLRNNLWYNTYQAGISQSYTYSKGTFKVVADLPLTCFVLSVNDKIPNKFTKYNRLIFNPSLSLKYEYRAFDFDARGNMLKHFGNIDTGYTGIIMHGYRSFIRNTIDELFESRSAAASAAIGYKDPIKAWFINLNGGYAHSWKNLLYGYDYQGILSMRTAIERPTKSDNYNLKLGISKGFDFCSTTLRLSGSYNNGVSEQLIQNEIFDYRSLYYTAAAGLNTNPFSFLSIDYNFSWNRNNSYIIERPDDFPAIRQTSQTAGINIFPTKGITINFKIEQQYNSIASQRYTMFADAGIKLKNKNLDIELEINNLFNAKQYVSASYSDISTYYYSYNLRPISALLKFRFKL